MRSRGRRSATGVRLYVALVVLAGLACEHGQTRRRSAVAMRAATRDSTTASFVTASTTKWNDTVAGRDLFVAGANPTEAIDIMPRFTDTTLTSAPELDTVLARHPQVDLFARQGHVGTATLSAQAEGNFSGSCTTWPTAHVNTSDGPPPDWSVAFIAGHASALPMDSVPVLNAQDSAKRAAQIARVASALPNDTAESFRGVPFSLRDAHQFTLPSGDTVIAAEVVRRLNQEANPEEEHILIIMERDTVPGPNGAPPQFIAAYSERTSGAEDDVETDEVLAGVLLGHGPRVTPTIVLDRDYGDGNAYTLIQRTAPRQWHPRWSSAYVGC